MSAELVFDLLEGLKEAWRAVDPAKADALAAGFARGTGGIDVPWLVEQLGPAAAAIAQGRIEELERERVFVWKWVERAMFDDALPFNECLSTIANYPGAPWKQGRWNVDHKPYAEKLYKVFPNARATLNKDKS